MNFCQQCGDKLGPAAQFCSACGHAVVNVHPSPATPLCASCGLTSVASVGDICQACQTRQAIASGLVVGVQSRLGDRTNDATTSRGWIAVATCIIPGFLIVYSAITKSHDNYPVIDANAALLGQLLVFVGFAFLVWFFVLSLSMVAGNSKSATIARIIAICGACTYALLVLSVHSSYGRYDLSWRDLVCFGFPTAYPFVADAIPD